MNAGIAAWDAAGRTTGESTMTTADGSSGWRMASENTITPPMLWPMNTGCSSPSSPASQARSSAKTAIEYSCSGWSLAPWPRRSTATTVCPSAAKCSTCGAKQVWSQHQPCTNTSGVRAPSVRS